MNFNNNKIYNDYFRNWQKIKKHRIIVPFLFRNLNQYVSTSLRKMMVNLIVLDLNKKVLKDTHL